MSFQIRASLNCVLFCAVTLTIVGNSFPAFANSDEKNLGECERALGTSTGGVEFQLTDIVPSRVRIMPVGKFVGPHKSRSGEEFHVSVGDQELNILAGVDEMRTVIAISFATWDGLVPSWSLDEKMDSVLVAVSKEQELLVFYPFSPNRTPLSFPLPKGKLRNAQVVRDRDGRVLILTSRSDGGADVFALKDGALNPIAVGPSTTSHLYSGLGDRPWLAWWEIGPDMRVTVKTALFENLTSPAFSFSLEDGEQVTEFTYERKSESEGQLTVVTSSRTLRFSSQSH